MANAPYDLPEKIRAVMSKLTGSAYSVPDAVNQALGGANSADPWGGFTRRAHAIAQQRGFPVNVLLGQAAIESARGQSAPGNNYFGIKGQGTAGSNNLATQEYGNGGYYGENSNFAAYHNPEESINHYIDLVMSYPGVPQAVASGNPDAVVKAIKGAGYATSPTYVQTVENTPEYRGGL